MTKQRIYFTVLLLSSLCFLMVFSGCSSGNDKSSDNVPENVTAGGNQETSALYLENLGEFSVQDITGESYTQEMFSDYDLTMVNVFTTWCTPCVNEIPDLEKLKNELSGQGVNVVGFVLDAIDGNGNTSEDAIEKAKLLAEKTGVSYPFLIPDKSYLNGRLSGINAVPETFFVDKEGNIVGSTYSGSRSFEDWKSIVETELKGAAK